MTWLRMRVIALSVDPLSNLPIVVLVDEADHTHLPIAIGLGEAAAIAAELDGIDLERPMTHQLACELLSRSGAEVAHVELVSQDDEMISARVVLRLIDGSRAAADSRPSDAIALALRSGAAIRVAPELLEQAARVEPDRPRPALLIPDDLPVMASVGDAGGELLAALDAGAFGKWKM